MASEDGITSTSEGDVLFTIRRDQGTSTDSSTNISTSTDIPNNTEAETGDSSYEKPTCILCVMWRHGKLGAAYYNIDEKQLYMYSDMVDLQPSFLITRTILNEVNPSHIITMGNLTDDYIKCLVDILANDETSIDSVQVRHLPQNMTLLSFKEYTYMACEYKIFSLRLPSEPENATENEREFYLQSLIDVKNKRSIHALGALIKYAESNWGHMNPECDGQLVFLHLHSVTMKNHIYMDQNTFNALHVFKIENHDSSFKHGGMQSNREGWSIYKLISQYCRSNLGYICARKLLMNPVNDIDELNRRLDFIQFTNNPTNSGFIDSLQENIKKITDITLILERVQYSRASSSDWISLYNSIYHALFIHEICRPYREKSILLAELGNSVTGNLYGLENGMNNALDFKESAKRIRPVVKFGLDDELDAKKLKRKDISNNVTAAANFAVGQLPDYINECVVLYVPEHGYLIAMKEWEPNCDRYQLEGIGFQYLFEMKGMLHYKNAMCKELDTQLGNIHLDIIGHENRIIQRLCGYVLKYNGDIRDPLKIIGLIDCLISMAKVSKEKGYIRPKLNTDNIHEIAECKHPLMEMYCDTFVSNDFYSGGPHSHVKIITGPNASGKSVYLKQMGLIIYLAHVGMCVPAKEANIGMTFSIHTRIHTSESAAIRLSAFMIDLTQMCQALNSAKPSSFIMIDEFGRGTTGIEGISLQTGALEKFLRQEECCPHILVSTHVQQTSSLLPESHLISYMKMDHTKQDKEIIYLYKLVPGVSVSYASEVAIEAGLDPAVVARAVEILEALKDSLPIRIMPQNNAMYNNKEYENNESDINVPEPED